MMTSISFLRWCLVSVAVASLSMAACGGSGDDDDSSGGESGDKGSGGTSGTGGSGGSGKGGTGGTLGKGGSVGKGGTSGTNGDGTCQPTCAKTCATDNDCETAQGELCCDYGAPGKACTVAVLCPRRCEDDSSCTTNQGEACLSTSLASPKECVASGGGLRTCTDDSDCTSAEVCCGIYNQAICVPTGYCPASCEASSDCNTAQGETCCTSVRAVEPNLAVDGLCLNPTYGGQCPKTCKSSSECSTASGEICCNGLCDYSCPKSCKQSSDCTSNDARICCTSASARLPKPTRYFSVGPTCMGNAYSCPTLGNLSSSYCTPATGCSPSSQPCSGTPYTCDFSDGLQSECEMRPGCSYDEDTGFCDGTPDPCADSATSTECYANYGCSWLTMGGCTGTATPCSQMPSNQCSANPGCYLGQAL